MTATGQRWKLGRNAFSFTWRSYQLYCELLFNLSKTFIYSVSIERDKHEERGKRSNSVNTFLKLKKNNFYGKAG
jgi:hypothetical protein